MGPEVISWAPPTDSMPVIRDNYDGFTQSLSPVSTATVTNPWEYVFDHLPSHLLPRLVAPLPWGEGLTDETYLDWILSKAGRLFLILVDIGIPERVFSLVDESFDDVDLPIAAHSVDRLKLSADGDDPTLDAKFFHAQWRFLVRGLKQGDHIKYTENEGVPVEILPSETALAREGVEKIVLAGAACRVYLRTHVTIGGAPHFFEEEEVLEEIRSLRRFSHDHVFSIYASYFVDDMMYILFSGIYDRTLMSFLNEVPHSFKRLPKDHRRRILIDWPHCLADGLSWLHAHSQVHGAIRPSNILIDSEYRIFLGQFEALDTLLPPVKIDDVESYQYGAPERWVRSAIVHDNAPARTALPSGGRTGRRQPTHGGKLGLFASRTPRNEDSIDHSAESIRAESVASHGTVIRIGGRSDSPSRFSFGFSSSSSGSSGGSTRKRAVTSVRRPILYTPSITSSNSSGSSDHSAAMTLHPVRLPGTHSNAAVVQTWQSRQTNPEASDIFSLGAVTLDILTHLCKRKISAFAHHRGAKNRTPGRGGGVADCSFHLDRNIGQVSSWIALLDSDARKRSDPVFRAIEPMLTVVRCMLHKEPGNRPSAARVESRFVEAIRQIGDAVTPHCTSKLHFRAPALSNTALPRASPNTPVLTQPMAPITPCSSPPETGCAGYTDWIDTYAASSDSDRKGNAYTAPSSSHRNPWWTPDGRTGPAAAEESFQGYGIAISDG
ncbi:protein kinase domain-containing protein [Aspergillus clavatus NRRL 1]|uniref:Protein kinase domain-containing protein n=1 Tax=Aspergillus clavatus (strain ATCC 1007 / CBS 513.65 / DSM 816 / NCTC 3887 / NRRL 1 / QM 1276 / 107) TaxID=344612 RepID=A1CL52_ASPCL|nr:protein kinase domain-containing protein [Aspergillus clavatus NRRL 1]EAW09876.1 protein kinase domain-containing protein [Aspergillus clavatus NRRL 1]